jgi:hypothetical protein
MVDADPNCFYDYFSKNHIKSECERRVGNTRGITTGHYGLSTAKKNQ